MIQYFYENISVIGGSVDSNNNIQFGDVQFLEHDLSSELVSLSTLDWFQDNGSRPNYSLNLPNQMLLSPVVKLMYWRLLMTLLELADRDLLAEANINGLLKQAVRSSFDLVQNQKAPISQNILNFVNGENIRLFEWVRFESPDIQGAYVSDGKQIRSTDLYRTTMIF